MFAPQGEVMIQYPKFNQTAFLLLSPYSSHSRSQIKPLLYIYSTWFLCYSSIAYCPVHNSHLHKYTYSACESTQSEIWCFDCAVSLVFTPICISHYSHVFILLSPLLHLHDSFSTALSNAAESHRADKNPSFWVLAVCSGLKSIPWSQPGCLVYGDKKPAYSLFDSRLDYHWNLLFEREYPSLVWNGTKESVTVSVEAPESADRTLAQSHLMWACRWGEEDGRGDNRHASGGHSLWSDLCCRSAQYRACRIDRAPNFLILN